MLDKRGEETKTVEKTSLCTKELSLQWRRQRYKQETDTKTTQMHPIHHQNSKAERSFEFNWKEKLRE